MYISDIWRMEVIDLKTKRCPFCDEVIQARAVKCRYCGEFLNTDKAMSSQAGCNSDSQSDCNTKQTVTPLFIARPSLWAMAGAIIKGLIVLAIAVCLIKFNIEESVIKPAAKLLDLNLTGNQYTVFTEYRKAAGIGLGVLAVLVLLIKTVKLKSIYYEVTPDRIEWGRGIFVRKVDNLDMFRIVDLKLRRNLLDCVVGVGTVELITSDKTDSQFVFEKIHSPRKLYDIIKRTSLEADQKRSVVHLE